MKYAFKKLPNSIIEAEINLNHKEFLNYYQPVYDSAISQAHLKGFRPGTAPKELADKAIDKEKVFNEAVEKAARASLKEITEENNWELVDQPKVEALETDPQADLGLKFKATLAIFPEIKLGNYKKIAKKALAEKKEVKATEEELKKTIKWILESRPKTDPASAQSSGKQSGKAPELTDEFVKTLGKFENVEQFKNNIRDGIQKEKEMKEMERIRLKIMDEIIKDSSIDIPQIMIEKTLESMLADYRALLKNNPEREAEMRKKLEEKAKNSVASNLVIYGIAKTEKLEPTSEEVEAEANKFNIGVDPKKLYDYSYGVVQNRKVFEFLENFSN